MEATFAFVFVALVVLAAAAAAAAACFAAARAHARTAEVCREMETTWKAISYAQRAIKRGDPQHADELLERAGLTIIAYRKRRGEP